MRGTGSRRLRGDRGAEVVEFAIIVPIVLVIFAAIINFGFMLNAQVTVTQAAREGARIAALNPCSSNPCSATDDATVDGIVKPKTEDAAPGLTITDAQVDVTGCAAGADQTTDAVVIVDYTVNLAAPLLTQTVHVRGKAHMPCGG
jgi:Flp pilus assembly protein TadG